MATRSWSDEDLVSAWVKGATYDELREQFGIGSNELVVEHLRRGGARLKRRSDLTDLPVEELVAIIDGQRQLLKAQDRTLQRRDATIAALQNDKEARRKVAHRADDARPARRRTG
jgi:hypothetical protein